jgi:chemotaxis signal transduction protein
MDLADQNQLAPRPVATGLLRPSEALTRFAPAARLAPLREAERSTAALRYGFRCARLGLLAPVGEGSEALEPTRIAPVPHAPPWLVGMMNLRGNPVAVFDLHTALALPRNDGSQRTFVLVLGKGERAVGLLIDGLPRALRPALTVALPTGLPQRLAPFARQAWMEGSEVWIDFDSDAFLSFLGGTA